MASPTVNVVRYTALFTGVVYGWYHRRTLQAEHKIHKIEAATHQRQQLVAQAKEAWIKHKTAPPKTADTLVTDPDDPNFDLEKLLARWEATS